MPGGFIPQRQLPQRAYAYGAVGIGVRFGDAQVWMGDGKIYVTMAKQRQVVFRGRLQPYRSRAGIVLERSSDGAQKQSQHVRQLVDAGKRLPMACGTPSPA